MDGEAEAHGCFEREHGIVARSFRSREAVSGPFPARRYNPRPRRNTLLESGNHCGSPKKRDPAAGLLHRWQEQGDPDALDELLRLEVGLLKNRLRSKGPCVSGDPVSVSDIAQETVVRFLEVDTAPRFDSPAKLRAYLWTAAWRLLVQRLQKAERHALRIDEMESWNLGRGLSTSGGLGALDERERSVALDLALNLLRPPEREILRLVYLEHLGIEGAAKRLGLGRDAAKMRLVRARRELARKLCRWEETIEAE